jgi:hypothetical protein
MALASVALVGFRGGERPHPTKPPTRAPSRALPRRRTLCTNWKKPRYYGSLSCEMPRCGRSQERSSDQKPSIVLSMYLAEVVAVLVAGIFAASMADGLVRIAPGWQPGVDVVFIGVDQCVGRDRCGNDRLDRGLLHIGQHAQHDLIAALDHPGLAIPPSCAWRNLEPASPEDRWLVLFQRAASRRALKPAPPSQAPLVSTSAGWPLCPATM